MELQRSIWDSTSASTALSLMLGEQCLRWSNPRDLLTLVEMVGHEYPSLG